MTSPGVGPAAFFGGGGPFWTRMSLSAESSLFFFRMDTCLFPRLVLFVGLGTAPGETCS